MKTISIINLKGGVGKTISAVNIAHILATRHGKRVLLIDNDKQGNTTKFFCGDNEHDITIAHLLTDKAANVRGAALPTGYANLRVIPADMGLVIANRHLMIDTIHKPQTRLKKALEPVSGDYDYCIIDNAPDIALNTSNALIASDYVIIPVKLDNFVLEGLEILTEHIADIQEDWNSGLSLLGCFITMRHNERRRDNERLHSEAVARLKEITGVEPFAPSIWRSPKVDESTYTGKPIVEFSRGSAAAHGYIELTAALLERCDASCAGS